MQKLANGVMIFLTAPPSLWETREADTNIDKN
jgi:hypothetical protein